MTRIPEWHAAKAAITIKHTDSRALNSRTVYPVSNLKVKPVKALNLDLWRTVQRTGLDPKKSDQQLIKMCPV